MTVFSMTLDRKGMLEIGLKFLSSLADRLDFFSLGKTMDCFMDDGTLPVLKLRLISFVMRGARTDIQRFSSLVGTGSKITRCRREALTMDTTWSSEIMSKFPKRCWVDGDRSTERSSYICYSRLSRSRLILALKKLLNS